MAEREDDLREMSEDIVSKYGQETIPSCRCFHQTDGVIDENGLQFVSQAMALGESVAMNMISSGLCPTAAPSMVGIMVDIMAFHLAMTELGDRHENNPYNMVDIMESVHDRIAAQLRIHRGRSRRIINESVAGRTEGSC